MKILDLRRALNAEAERKQAIAQFDMIDRALAERPYLGGDAFSIADITAWVTIDLGTPSVYEVGPEFDHIHRWREDVSSRPSVRSL